MTRRPDLSDPQVHEHGGVSPSSGHDQSQRTVKSLTEWRAARALGITRDELRRRARAGEIAIEKVTFYKTEANEPPYAPSSTKLACDRYQRILGLSRDIYPLLQAPEILTLLGLNRFSDPSGGCMFASELTLCKQTRLSRRRLRAALRKLRETDLLIADIQPGRTTIYRFGPPITGESE